jgi:hypothetical protein
MEMLVLKWKATILMIDREVQDGDYEFVLGILRATHLFSSNRHLEECQAPSTRNSSECKQRS